ncbi:MAG: hypothetical protein R3B68_01950 [Phycisphaerales bacterium]
MASITPWDHVRLGVQLLQRRVVGHTLETQRGADVGHLGQQLGDAPEGRAQVRAQHQTGDELRLREVVAALDRPVGAHAPPSRGQRQPRDLQNDPIGSGRPCHMAGIGPAQ